jgi:hypothetical protein
MGSFEIQEKKGRERRERGEERELSGSAERERVGSITWDGRRP